MRKKLLLIIAILLTATQGSMAMQIFVKTITGKTITIDVDNSSVTIYSVKEKILEKESYSVESQILLSNGNVLDNDKTLDFYGIGKESTIDVRIAISLVELSVPDSWQGDFDNEQTDSDLPGFEPTTLDVVKALGAPYDSGGNFVFYKYNDRSTISGVRFYNGNEMDGVNFNRGSVYVNRGTWRFFYTVKNTATLTDGDDLSALSAYAGKYCEVTYMRSFTSGKPSTVCLPFAYAPKTGETFYTFTGITKNGSEYIADMTEYTGTNLVANTPYLFIPTGDADFSGTYAIPVDLTAGTTTNGDWTFIGTYTTESWTEAPTGIYGFSAQTVDEQGISQGEFVKVGAYVRVKPMRCYLKYKNGGEDYAGARAMNRAAAADEQLPETIKVRLIAANGDVNAIGTLHTQTGEVVLDGWYTLDGTRLFGQPTRKGIYLNNGKKVVIK